MVKTLNRYLTLLSYSNKVPFCIKFAHKSGISAINKCLGAKILLMNVTQTNEHSNVSTFVCALVAMYVAMRENFHGIIIRTYWFAELVSPYNYTMKVTGLL